MISSSFSLSINIKSRVPVLLLLVILNGASKSYTISWLYQNLSSRVLNEFRDFAVTTVSWRQFHGSVIRIGNTFFLKFNLALCVNSFRECYVIELFSCYKKETYCAACSKFKIKSCFRGYTQNV